MTNETEAPERMCVVNCGLPAMACACYRSMFASQFPADLSDAKAARIAELEASLGEEQDAGGWAQHSLDMAIKEIKELQEKLAKAGHVMQKLSNYGLPMSQHLMAEMRDTLADLQKPIATRDDPA